MYKEEFDFVFKLLEEVRPLILSGYHHEFDVEIKEDGSPVTNIDKAVDSFLRNALKEAFPNYALLTEETLDDKSRLDNDYVWIIDPIDGTREFVAHQYEFVTNIALVYKHEVVLSFILEPLSFEIYYAIKGEGAYLYKDGVADAACGCAAVRSVRGVGHKDRERHLSCACAVQTVRYRPSGYQAAEHLFIPAWRL